MSNDAEPSAWITSRSPFVISEPARQIACSFESAGIEFWMVGGNIRDWTMNRESSDEDIVVAPPFQNAEAIVASMPGFSVKGDPNGNAAEHGSFKASAQGASDIIDVTEFRGDVISFQQDASRRDFTINAFGGKVNPDNGEVVEIWDFNDGFGDIVRGLIRAIGDPMKRFDGNEDPGHSRVMRAFRFAARFGFNIHPATLSAIATNRENALMAHRQVIGDEMAKIASAPFAHRVIPQMVSTGLMDVIISAIPGVEETNIAPADRFAAAMRVAANENFPAAVKQATWIFAVGARTSDQARTIHNWFSWTKNSKGFVARAIDAFARFEQEPAANNDIVARQIVNEFPQGSESDVAMFARAAQKIFPNAFDNNFAQAVARVCKDTGWRQMAIDGEWVMRETRAEGPGIGAILRQFREATIEDPQRNNVEWARERFVNKDS